MATVGSSVAGQIVLPSQEICLFSLAAFNVIRDGFHFQMYPVWYPFLYFIHMGNRVLVLDTASQPSSLSSLLEFLLNVYGVTVSYFPCH